MLKLHTLLFGSCLEIVVVKGFAFIQPLFAAMSSHINEDPAPGDTTFGNGLDRGLFIAAHGAARIVAVPDLAVVPDVPEGVVLG